MSADQNVLHLGPSRRDQPMGWMDWPPFEGLTTLQRHGDHFSRAKEDHVPAWTPRPADRPRASRFNDLEGSCMSNETDTPSLLGAHWVSAGGFFQRFDGNDNACMPLVAWRSFYDVATLRAQMAAQAAEILLLRTALRFYARTEHYHLDPDEQFDTVSGEPQNWLFSSVEGSETMIEDGSVARQALRGQPTNYMDGDEDATPQPIEGEVSCNANGA